MLEDVYKWKEKRSKSYSAHSMAAVSPKSSGAGGTLNSLHQADTWSQGMEASGTQGGPWGMRRALHRCREIDLGTKPERQRTAVEKIWAATGVKGNHGEGG